MCANCISNAEAAAAWAGVGAYALKPRVHQMLANCGLAPEPDPVAHDVRTVAFLRALDLDPVESLGAARALGRFGWMFSGDLLYGVAPEGLRLGPGRFRPL